MSARPSKRSLARQRQLNVLLRAGRAAEAAALEASWSAAPAPSFTPKAKEPAAYVERDADGQIVRLTDDGLNLVERLARQGAPQSKIAASLGILQKQFKNLLGGNRGDNAIRFAWERGQGDYEFSMVKLLMKHGKTSFVPVIYLSKSRLGWTEDAKQASAQIQNNVVLQLPKSRTRAEYFAMLGIPDPKALVDGPTSLKTVVALPSPGQPAPDDQQPESQPDDGATAPELEPAKE